MEWSPGLVRDGSGRSCPKPQPVGENNVLRTEKPNVTQAMEYCWRFWGRIVILKNTDLAVECKMSLVRVVPSIGNAHLGIFAGLTFFPPV